MLQLTEPEKKYLALCLFSMCMKQGPGFFEVTMAIAEKIGIMPELEFYTKDWLEYNAAKKKTDGATEV